MTHAFFKALLFLAAGAVILSLHHEQNIFNMGGLWKRLPIAFWTFIIGAAALVALPLTSGYYSKHEILLAAYAFGPPGFWLWTAGVAGALLTAIYSARLILVAFFGPERTQSQEHLPLSITLPLLLLALLSLFGGLLQMPLKPVLPAAASHQAANFAQLVMAITPFAGILVAFLFYGTRRCSPSSLLGNPIGKGFYRLWIQGWGFDWLYDRLLVKPYLTLAALNKSDAVDRLYTAIIAATRWGHYRVAATQTGRLRMFAAAMVLGSVLMLAIGVLP